MKKLEFKYYLTIIVFSVLSMFVFIQGTNKTFFYQLNFDQEKIVIIEELDQYQLKINSFMDLTLKIKGDEITKLDTAKQYMFKYLDKDEAYYFSFQNLLSEDNTLHIKNVVWHLSYPTIKSGVIQLHEVNLPFKEFPDKESILYISTKEDCAIKEGKMFRFLWDEKYSNVRFIGNSKDVLGYNFFDINGDLDQLDQYTDSSKILINILNTDLNEVEYSGRLSLVIDKIKKSNPNKNIFISTPLYKKEDKQFQLLLNRLLSLKITNNRVFIINLQEFYNLDDNNDCFIEYKMSNTCIKSLISFSKNKMNNINK